MGNEDSYFLFDRPGPALTAQIDRLAELADIEPEPLSLEALELAEKTVGLDEVLHGND